jgi:hypothetical protein
LTRFSNNTWSVGYGGWSLYFCPIVIEAVSVMARRLPETMDRQKAYRRMNIALLLLKTDPGPSRNVFEDAVEPGTNNRRKSDAPPIAIEASSEWVMCPYCDRRFKLSDPLRWNGERHSTCGQRLLIR